MNHLFEARATRLGPFRPALLALPLLLSLGAIWLVLDGSELGFLVQVVAFLIAGILIARRPRPRQRTRVWVDAAGALYVGTERFAEAGEIASMLTSAQGQRALISIERAGGERRDLELASAANVAELRSTLTTNGAQMASQSFRGHVPFGVLGSLAVIAVSLWAAGWLALHFAKDHPLLVSLAVPTLFTGLPLAIAFARTYTLAIGAEGIWLRRAATGHGRLIRHRDLRVRRGRVAHMLVLQDERKREVSLELGNANEARSLAASLRHRRELKNAAGGEALEARLARGERDAAAWIEDLREQADPRSAGYRVAKVGAEQLWAVLENPDTEYSARIGAAVSLRLQAEGEGVRERLRIAASTTALPEVRRAAELLAAQEDGDEGPALARLARSLR